MKKSPLRYPGGKSRAIKLISDFIPEFKEFREPFIGGGSLFIYLKQLYPQRKFWINDLYTPLYNFWEMSQNNLDEVIERVLQWKECYPEGFKLYNYLENNYIKFDSIKKASAFFISNRITFSGATHSGGYSEQAFMKRFTDSSIERLRVLKKILTKTKITNLDYEKVVRMPSKDVFIFLDPPYFSTKKSALYGENGNLHKIFDHDRFAEVMKTCKHKWLITYDDSKYIKKIFSFAKNIKTWDLTYGMRNVIPSSNQIGKELFISNY